MNKIYFLLLIVCLSGRLQAQLYNNGGTISISSNATLHVGGTFTNATNGVIANNGTLNLTGNLVNNQSMSAANSGTLTFAGSSTQTVSGADSYLAKNITINNPTGVTLSKALKADGEVKFQSGVVAAASASEPLIFTANGTVSTTNAPANGSHVNGYVRKEGTGAFTYPVGDGTRYQKLDINPTANSGGITVKYFAADAGSGTFTTTGGSSTALSAYNTAEYWDATPVGTATGTVTVYWDDYNNTSTAAVADRVIAHKTGGNWLNEGGTGTGSTSAGSVQSVAVSTWSPFTMGIKSAVLPIELLSFSGKNTEGGNLLTWTTANEVNNKGFSVERLNGSTWENIGFKTANNKASTYQFLDNNPLSTSYYRLRQIDNDGKETFSKTIYIQTNSTKGKLAVYPNPVSNLLTIENTEGGNFEIINLLGQHVLSGKAASQVDVSALPQGSYVLKVGAEQVKFVKQ
jgi:Secretion system C-terminal sorting domain